MRTLLLAATVLVPALVASTAKADTTVRCTGGDATVAINAALAAGGTTTLTAGTCLISASLVMLVSNSALIGAGEGTTIIQAPAGGLTTPLITMSDGRRVDAIQNVRISGLTLDGMGNPSPTNRPLSGSGESGIVVPSGNAADISSVEVRNMLNTGVRFGGQGSVTHSYVHDIGGNAIYVEGVSQPGLPVFPAGPVKIIGNLIVNPSLAQLTIVGSTLTWDGIDCDPWHVGCDIENNTLSGSGSGATAIPGKDILLLDSSTNWVSTGDKIINNTVIGSNVAGIDVAQNISNFTVHGNVLINDENNSIVVGGASNGTVYGNVTLGGGPILIHTNTTNVTAHSNISN